MFKNLSTVRDLVISLVALAIGATYVYEKLHPVSPAPDRLEVAAKAYLKIQSQSLRLVADRVDAGQVKAADYGAELASIKTPAAAEIDAALKAAPSFTAALRKAADLMDGGAK